jgi:hypothetical protein
MNIFVTLSWVSVAELCNRRVIPYVQRKRTSLIKFQGVDTGSNATLDER